MCKTTDFLVDELRKLRAQADRDSESLIASMIRENELRGERDAAREEVAKLQIAHEQVSNAHKLVLLEAQLARDVIAEMRDTERDMAQNFKVTDAEASKARTLIHNLLAVQAWAEHKIAERAPLTARASSSKNAWDKAQRERRRVLRIIRQRRKAKLLRQKGTTS